MAVFADETCFFALLKHLGAMCFTLLFYIADNCTCQVVIWSFGHLSFSISESGYFAHYK